MKTPTNLSVDRYDYAFRVLERTTTPSKLVFDIGCGDGRMKKVETLGYSWRGFDREAWELADAWDLSEPCPHAEKAGAILLLDVLEHCVSPGLALQNLSGAMEAGGRLVLTMPNPRWSAYRIYTLFSGYGSGFTPNDLEENHHLFPIWPHVVERLLSYAGFSVDEYVTLDGATRIRPLKFPIDLTRIFIETLDPSAKGMSYGLVATKTGPGGAKTYSRQD